MNELRNIINSSLHHMKFTDEMKERVLEEGRNTGRRESRGKGESFIRYAVPVAACLVLCIGTTAAAKALLWDKYVAGKYNIESDEQAQEKMVEEGLVSEVDAVAEDNGIRIEVIQTVASGNHLDCYLKIQAEDEETAKLLSDTNPDYEISFANSTEAIGEGGKENDYTGKGVETEFVEGEKGGSEGPGYMIYNISSSVTPDSNLNGDTVYLKIHNFVGNTQTSPDKVVEGDWELSWNIQASKKNRTYVFEKEYTLYGKNFKLNKVELSSTGIICYLDKEAIDEQGLMKAESIYMVQSKEAQEKGKAGLGEYESAEWRGICGIPLEAAKNLTEAEELEVFEQIKAGTYQGEYMEAMDWERDMVTHTAIEPWDVYIQYADGVYFTPQNDTGYTTDTDEEYIIVINYTGYLNVNEVSAIQFGDCVIPLSDGTEQ